MISNSLELMTLSSQLSEEDRKMLKLLLDSEGRITSQELSRQFGVSLNTVQRRRRRLEGVYFTRTYSLDPMKFGYRRIELLIYTEGGRTIDIGIELLKREEAISVFRTLGEREIDLRVEVLVKNNGVLLDLLEQVKAIKGVRDVVWTELIEPIKMTNPQNPISDKLDIKQRSVNLIKNTLKTLERPAFSPLQTTPAMEIAVDLPKRSSEELRILGRIAVNGQ
ncbi:MAG TPA: Lrp/AsnC family transcriptional regulator [Nitrososphaerales archaeon]|nr:Lrp/AsnC family transcriptional regulator [Nitrososphaerales archaeon]